MIQIKIGIDGVPSERKISIGNKYENQDEKIMFDLPSEFDNFNKYVISVVKVNGQKYTSVLPVIDNTLIISTQLTQYAGKWSMYLMAREKTKLNLDITPVDISAQENEHVFISDGFIGIISDSEIDSNNLESLTLDTNLKIMYDDLAKLKDELIERMKEPLYSYNQLSDIPEEFNPSPHDHNDLYFQKDEINDLLDSKSDKEHKHNDIYYQKNEVDEFLSNKVNVAHNHNDLYYDKQTIDQKLNKKSDIDHNHDSLYYEKENIDKKLDNKAELVHNHNDLYYTKTDIDKELMNKANIIHTHNDLYYEKNEVNSMIEDCSPLDHEHNNLYYPKENIDSLLLQKSDNTHNHDDKYYTKSEEELLLANKANFEHYHTIQDITDFPSSLPANGGNSRTVNGYTVLSNVPSNAKFTDTIYVHPDTHPASMITGLATKLSELENDKLYQTKSEVDKAISALVNSAPEALDTLEELANALGNDPNFATTIMTMLGTKANLTDLDKKVDVVAGKKLSSNDFTNDLKSKLINLENYDDSKIKEELNRINNSVYVDNSTLHIDLAKN